MAAAVVSAAGLYACYKYIQSRSSNRPPQEGWLPFIGCAVEFGKAPLLFIKRCIDKVPRVSQEHTSSQHIQHGSVFTIYAAGKKMTFLLDPEHFDIVFNGVRLPLCCAPHSH